MGGIYTSATVFTYCGSPKEVYRSCRVPRLGPEPWINSTDSEWTTQAGPVLAPGSLSSASPRLSQCVERPNGNRQSQRLEDEAQKALSVMEHWKRLKVTRRYDPWSSLRTVFGSRNWSDPLPPEVILMVGWAIEIVELQSMNYFLCWAENPSKIELLKPENETQTFLTRKSDFREFQGGDWAWSLIFTTIWQRASDAPTFWDPMSQIRKCACVGKKRCFFEKKHAFFQVSDPAQQAKICFITKTQNWKWPNLFPTQPINSPIFRNRKNTLFFNFSLASHSDMKA